MILFSLIFPLVHFLELRFEPSSIARMPNAPSELITFLMRPPTYGLVAKLIKNPKYQFKKEYLSWCFELTPETLGIILNDLKNQPNLLRELMTVECLDSSFHYGLLHDRRLDFLGIRRFESFNLIPTLLLGRFGDEVELAIKETNRKRLNLPCFCHHSRMSPEVFRFPSIWKILSIQCLENLCPPNSSLVYLEVVKSFLDAFKIHPADSNKCIFMKIVPLLAFHLYLDKIGLHRYVCTSTLDLSVQYLNTLKDKSDPWAQLSMQYLMAFNGKQFKGIRRVASFSYLAQMVYDAFKTDPVVNAPWILSFTYLFKKTSNSIIGASTTHMLIDWLFSRSPSSEEVCKMYTIIEDQFYKERFHAHLRNDLELFELVADRCMVADLSDLSLKVRFNRFLSKVRSSDMVSIVEDIHDQTLSFPALTAFVMDNNDLAFDQYRFRYTWENDRVSYGYDIIKAWIDLYMKQERYYHVVSKDSSGVPVIIPSLLMPNVLAYVFGHILVRMIVYDIPWPFHLPRAVFTLRENHYQHLHKSYTDSYDSCYVKSCSLAPDCDFSVLEKHLSNNYKYEKLAAPIDEETLEQCSTALSYSILKGISDGFDNQFTEDDILQILHNKLR